MNKLFSFFRSGSSGYLNIDPTSAGLSLGMIGVISVVAYSCLAYGTGYGIEIETVVESLLPGYSLSLGGTIIGAIWMFSLGYIFGFLYAWLYNKLIKKA